MGQELRILVIEDVPTDAELEVRELKRAGLRVAHRVVDTEAGYRDALRDFRPDVILSDFSMPHFDGMMGLALARELVPDVPFIFVSGTIGEEYAIRALKNGATDYVMKNNLVRLPAAVERALQESAERAALRKSDAQLQTVFENLTEGVAVSDLDGQLLHFNRAAIEMHGFASRDEYLRRLPEFADTFELSTLDGTILPVDQWPLARILRGEMLRDLEMSIRRIRNGWRRVFSYGGTLVRGADGQPLLAVVTIRDITERKEQELKIARLSRIHAVLSGINSTIVRVRDRQELFNEACRIAVEHGNFGIAWIGILDPAAQEVTPVAWAGFEASEYLGGEKAVIRNDTPQARGILAQAIKTRRAVFSNDITVNPEAGGKRREEAIRRGYRSVIVLPLIVEDEVLGNLSLFAKGPNFFDEDEMKLLMELSADISFALEHIAKEEKLEKLTRVRAVLSGINAAIVRIREREGLLRETCRIASEEGKFEMTWIGTIDSEKQEVRPVAWTGFSAEAALAVSWASVSAARGTLSDAIKTRKPAVRNDIGAELPSGKLRQEALMRGCLSTVCLPLEVEGRVTALIVLFATGRGFFDEGELALLGELASNISFALESIERQEKIERLSRIRRVLGEMNAAIVRIRDKNHLFEEACRIAHEHGKFAMSWIGMLDEATQAIRPVAKAGRDEGYLERLKLTIDPKITSNLALAVEAVARSAPVVCNDIATDGRMRPWRTAALERGYRSMVMLPLLLEQRAVGVFALYSPEPGFFDEEEMKLLIELAGDIAFALQTIEKQEKIDYLSYYDTLTDLPNRTLFIDRLSQHMHARGGEQRMVALILLDLERFRNMNETLGRHGGDELLKLIARRLEDAFHGKDYLAHLGADYFGVVIRGVRDVAEIARAVESQVLTCFGEPFVVNGKELRAIPRAGVALFPADGGNADTLFKNAEAALKKTKASSERYLFYAPQMNARVAEQLKLENELRNAIAHEQFVLHYQPRFDFASGEIVGMEALIRWKHPERGMVPPGEFIPLLEETGMILDVGHWALRRAALEHAAWRAKGRLPPRIAVNVSLAQLRRRDFVDQVKDALAPVDRAAERIDIEITESMLMDDTQGSIDKLKAVQSLGLHVALDDFGTGYSSLSYLARLPIDSLKIDRSFVIQMVKGPEQLAIVSTVISLARALNLKVVAEGVETEEQANLLRLLRCDEAQGYLFGRPVPPEELEEKLRQA